MNLSLNTVKRYARTREPEALRRAPRYRPTLVDPYRDHLRERRATDPTVPVKQLFREVQEQGYTGSFNLLSRYITQGRAEGDRPVTTPRVRGAGRRRWVSGRARGTIPAGAGSRCRRQTRTWEARVHRSNPAAPQQTAAAAPASRRDGELTQQQKKSHNY